MNKCIFIGRTTSDVEVRYAQNSDQTAIANVNIAVDDGYGDNKRTSFFKLVAFGKTAESMEKYVQKGTKIAVETKAQQNTWAAKDGTKRSEVSFIVYTWEFAQSKGDGTQTAPKTDANGFMNINDAIEEELPFN